MRLAALALALALLPASPATAGRACEERSLGAPEVAQALELAQAVAGHLPREGAAAAVLARVGADVTEHGLRWTHAGLLYREPGAPGWRVLHKLNRCGSAEAHLHVHGLGNFFLDDPHELRAWLLLPDASLQHELLRAVAGGGGTALHEPRYSMLAYPFALDYQNSNQWLLELLATAMAGEAASSRARAQQLLQRTDYRPDRIRVRASQRVGASLFRANVAFDDHPLAERLRGRYATVTVESIEDYLRRNGRLQAAAEIRLPGPATPDR